ncbi:hypothetical protein F53441_6151 [Fusarium austroafricanum]|uniref:CHAT domain-containing protein n=1 Tax=Fusarium austroafricanum TaxID=2364996 RepID=A0A8H4KKA5_9HYPO|nr:hypothetical protein F53441_6151 [Fusarium austroafricanum]
MMSDADEYTESLQAARRSLQAETDSSVERIARLRRLADLLLESPGGYPVDDLDEAIDLKFEALQLTPPIQQQAEHLIELAELNYDRYHRSYQQELPGASFLDNSIKFQRDAIQLSSNKKERADQLKGLGDFLLSRYKRTNMILKLDRDVRKAGSDGDCPAFSMSPSKDLEEAIAVSKRAISMLEKDDPVPTTWLLRLGNLFEIRYQENGVKRDLKKAFKFTRQARYSIEDADVDAPVQLAKLHVTRYVEKGRSYDIEKAISLAREALANSSSEGRFFSLRLLSNVLFQSNKKTKTAETMGHLDEAIRLAKEALDGANDSVQEIGASNLLYDMFYERYQTSGNIVDLGDIIEMARRKSKAFFYKKGYKGYGLSWKRTVGDWWHQRAGERPQYPDIEKALQYPAYISIDGSSQVPSLDDLAGLLYLRYRKTGAVQDLLEAVDTLRHLNSVFTRPQYLLKLGLYLLHLYEEIHEPAIADEATRISHQLGSDKEYQGVILKRQCDHYIAAELSLRYHTSGNLGKLNEAIKIGARVTQMFPDDPHSQAGAFHTLASSSYQLFCNTQLLSDLNEAMGHYKVVYDLMPKDDMNRGHCLNNYSHCHLQRYRLVESPHDLDEACRIGREAVLASSNGTYMREKILNDVATALYQRYLVFSTLDDLEKAISLGRQAVDLKLEDPINGCPSFLNLAAMLCELHTLTEGEESRRYLSEALEFVHLAWKTGNSYEKPHSNLAGIPCYCHRTDFIEFLGITEEDARTSVQNSQLMLRTSDERPCVSILSHTSDLVLMLSYSLLYGDPADMDIDEPVRLAREALSMTWSNNSPENLRWYSCILSIALGCRFTVRNNAEDLIESLKLNQQTVEMAADDDTHRPFYMIVYALGLHSRYSGTGRLRDLYNCIDIGFQAWNMSSKGKTAGDCRNQILCSSSIACFLTDKYLRDGLPLDLERAIEFRQAAENRLTALGHHESTDFYNMYMGSRNANPASEAGPMEAINLTLYDIRNCPSRLYSLSVELFRYYSQIQEPATLSGAISFCQPCVDSTPLQHQDSPKRRELLGRCLEESYRKQKASSTTVQEGSAITPHYMNHLNGALRSLQEVIDTAPPEDLTWSSALHLLGPLYSDRYHISGDIGDLKMSLIILDASVRATISESGLLSDRLRLLGAAKMDNFSLFDTQVDLDSAKEIFWKAVEITIQNCSSRARILLDLAAVYQADHRKTKSRQSLDTSLELFEETYKILTGPKSRIQGDEILSKIFSGRGLSYLEKFKTSRDPTDFLKSIYNISEASKLPRVSARERVAQLLDLANVNIAAYITPEDKSYSDAASDSLLDAAHVVKSMLSETRSIQAGLHFDIGNCYMRKYDATKLVSDLESAISFREEAFELVSPDTTGDLLMLMAIFKSFISALELKEHWEKAYNVVNRAIPLIATTTPRFLDISETQFLLSKYSNLGSDGAALVMSTSRPSEEAIEILEAGRGVAMLALSQLRSDTALLKPYLNATLIGELVTIQKDLEVSFSSLKNRINFEDVSKVGDDLKKEIRRIRAGQNFSNFVRNHSHDTQSIAFTRKVTTFHLTLASHGGNPIVVVNVSYRCDAFLITGSLTRALPLPKLSRQAIQDRINEGNFTSLGVLEWLWDTIASPVLEALGLTSPPPPGNPWPRRHMEKHSFNSVIDRAISSYCSSIRGFERIVRAKDLWGNKYPKGTPGAQKALVVSMEQTPDSRRLPYAVEEARTVVKACELMSVKTVERDQCTKDTVLRDLQSSGIFHFAGHGYTDNNDPSQSHLRLEDWKSNPLTVADLFALNLREKEPFLAYLGACGTGQIQDARHLDESIHLTSACQLVGFRHSIGTLCKVHDKTCVEVARITYDTIREKGVTDASVSEGLHMAIRHGGCADVAIRDASDYESDEDGDENIPLQWAPYALSDDVSD